MENIKSKPLSKEEKIERKYKQKGREIRIARTRALVLRKQIAEVYEILENIRFDFLGDTAFRDKIVKAKRNLENAVSDFLLDDSYWKERIEKLRKMTPGEYNESLKSIVTNTQG